ncbi:MAG: SufD family Fe-S cluster assembly protein [Acidobacteriota bacterium]
MSGAPKRGDWAGGTEALARLVGSAGTAGGILDRRNEHARAFAQGLPAFGKYSRLRLDWASLPQRPARFEPASLPVGGAQEDPRVASLADAVRKRPEILDELASPRGPWDHLLLAGWQEGALVRFPRIGGAAGPAVLTLGNPGGLVLEPLLFDVEEGAEAGLVVHWRPDSGEPSFRLSHLAGRVGPGARLKVFLLQEGGNVHHYLSGSVQVGRNAEVEFFSAWMGGKWTVVRLQSDLSEAGGSWTESHLSFGAGVSHLDLDSQVRLASHHGRSDVAVRAVGTEASRTVFTGNILMEKEAHHSEAVLSDHVLLLSPQAHADSIPGLEIKALEVKAAHAASVGQVDEEQIFYLQSRGLDPVAARRILVVGFLESLFERSPYPWAREVLDEILERRVGLG